LFKEEIVKDRNSIWVIKPTLSLSFVFLLGWLLLVSGYPRFAQAAGYITSQDEPSLHESQNGTNLRFAVIGDYGTGSNNEALVATMVASWNPDFVITTGDNNYSDGAAETIDENIGQFYSEFIGNYTGSYGSGSETNRFWPSLGNHDWRSISCDGNDCTGPYFDYFTLPNNERYYDVDLGLVHLYAIDSDSDEPDGRDITSNQAGWLETKLSTSQSCYDVVYFHHAPYSSGRHGSKSEMQWPFPEWGADLVLAGHDHTYERLDADGFPYFVNGAGGASLYAFENLGNLPSGVISISRYNEKHGAMLITASNTQITYQFFNIDGVLIDEYTSAKNCGPGENASPTVSAGPDQTITLPASAALDGTVSDDGLPNPPGGLTTIWTKESGPGVVSFGDTSAVDTTASFTVDGVYVLRLTADDGELTAYDEVTITVGGASLGFEPPEATWSVGGSFTLDIMVFEVSDLYGIELELSFEPTTVEVVDADLGTSGIQIQPGVCPSPDFVALNEVDNSTDTIIYAATSLSPSPPCDGGGVIASITFHGLVEGSSPVNFSSWLLSDTDLNTISVGSTTDGLLNVLAAGTLEGTVDLQGRSDESGAEVCAWQGGGIVDCTTTDVAGFYSLSLLEGTFDVTVEMARYLDAEKTYVSVVAGDTTTLTLVKLLGGDCNDDCIINILDLSFMGFRFGSSVGDPNWDERADVNNDGTINILDLTAGGVNFNKTCPVPWP
jgi:hypothetical protein